MHNNETIRQSVARACRGECSEDEIDDIRQQLTDPTSELANLVTILSSADIIPRCLIESENTEDEDNGANGKVERAHNEVRLRSPQRVLTVRLAVVTAAMAIVAGVCAVSFFDSRAAAAANAAVALSRERIGVANRFIMNCDYSRGEQLLIDARLDLERVSVSDSSIERVRRNIVARTWAMECEVQMHYGNLSEARRCIESADAAIAGLQPASGDCEEALTVAFISLAAGEVMYQEAIRIGGISASKSDGLRSARVEFERGRRALGNSSACRNRDEVRILEARLLSAMGLARHKDVNNRVRSDRDQVRREALQFQESALSSLDTVTDASSDEMARWVRSHVHARRALSYTSLREYSKAIEEYDMGVAVLEEGTGVGSVGWQLQMGLLLSGKADTFEIIGSLREEIECRDRALEAFTLCRLARSSNAVDGYCGVSYARRAIAKFLVGDRLSAIADANCFCALSDEWQSGGTHPSLNQSELVRVFLLVACGRRDNVKERERFLGLAVKRVEEMVANPEMPVEEVRERLCDFLAVEEIKEMSEAALIEKLLEQ